MEKWKPAAASLGLAFSYQVSNLGNIKNARGILMKPKPSNGYLRSSFKHDNGRNRPIFHHRIVAETWLKKPSVLHSSVDHINRNKLDNRVQNLRWATSSMQMLNKRKVAPNRSHEVIQMDLDGNFVQRTTLTDMATQEIDSESVKKVCVGKLQSAGGFKWRYGTRRDYGELEWRKVSPTDMIQSVYVSSGGHIEQQNGVVTRGTLHATGYLQVRLRRLDKRTSQAFSVHRLIAQAFLPAPPSKLEVNHIDGVKTNNNADNLEYATRVENARHAVNSGLISPRSTPVVKIDPRNGEIVARFNSMTEAAKQHGVTVGTIGEACDGLHKTAGFRWRRVTT